MRAAFRVDPVGEFSILKEYAAEQWCLLQRPAKDASAKGDENILDVGCLLVNRFRFKCIQRLGYRKVAGILARVSGIKALYTCWLGRD